ncbi:hypothetical protein CPB85DRAFT_645893 [Mucidula mucida]|nr:hypothetical protein CPB85DRAFT_645893 [Mucidula mucida]
MSDLIHDASHFSAFSRYRDDDRKSVHSVHSDSSDTTLVEDRADVLSPSSSPNGKEEFIKQVWTQQTFPVLASPPYTLSLDQCYPDSPLLDMEDTFVDASPPISLGSDLVKTIGAESYIPMPSDVFHSLLQFEGAIWVNKLPFVHSLCASRRFSGDTHKKLSLVRRPAGFGQRMFMSTATFSCEMNSRDIVERLLNSPPCSPLKHEYLVLSIDMMRAFEGPAESLEDAMNGYMDGLWRDFVRNYHVVLGMPRTTSDNKNWDWRSSATIVPWIMRYICNAGYRLLLFIDNFNHPFIHSTPETIETMPSPYLVILYDLC